MVPEVLLSEIWRQIASNDVCFVVKVFLKKADADSVTVNLSIIHFLLASVGFFLGDKIQVAKSVYSLWSLILTRLDLGLKHVVPVFFEELEEI